MTIMPKDSKVPKVSPDVWTVCVGLFAVVGLCALLMTMENGTLWAVLEASHDQLLTVFTLALAVGTFLLFQRTASLSSETHSMAVATKALADGSRQQYEQAELHHQQFERVAAINEAKANQKTVKANTINQITALRQLAAILLMLEGRLAVLAAQPAADAGVLLPGLDVALGAVLSDALTHAQIFGVGPPIGAAIYAVIFHAYEVLTRARFHPGGRISNDQAILSLISEKASSVEQSVRTTRESVDAAADFMVTTMETNSSSSA